jgi:small conductance mechanosensitive channel
MDIAPWTKLIFEKLERWATIFIKMLPNLILAVIVIALAYFIARLIRKIAYNVTMKISKSDSVSGVV